MPSLLYIHGFLSSPQSYKAQQMGQYCERFKPHWRYHCPQLSPYPDECVQVLVDFVESQQQPVYLIGSSMGGFWATWLSERYGCPAVLVNPAVNVMELLPPYVGMPLKNYHHDATYRMGEQHLQQLANYVIAQPQYPQRFWVLLQEGDETLDYRLAVEKYQGSRQTVEPGGDHGFQGFERFLDDIINFFENPSSLT